MPHSLRAWMEVIKLGSAAKLSKEVNEFYRNIVTKVFLDEGFFTFLSKPHNFDEIKANFNFTADDVLRQVLAAFVKDKTLKAKKGSYQTKSPVTVKDIKPRLLSQGNIDLSFNFAKFLPQRLKGEFYTSTSEFNLYIFDDLLTSNLYQQIRKAILAFSDVLKKEGRFLDLGTGSGVGLSYIFSQYLQRGAFDRDPVTLEMHGIDVDQDLLRIASEEFFLRLRKETKLNNDQLEKYEQYKPTFKSGTATQIPYPDNFFDIVYISQVLHWTDPAKAIREMARVVKDKGMVIGGQILMPHADVFLHLIMLVIEGAYGFFSKEQMKKWARDAGFKKMSFATPVTAFILKK